MTFFLNPIFSNRSVASFRFMRTGAHRKAKAISTDAEFFGTKLDISTIKQISLPVHPLNLKKLNDSAGLQA